MRIRKAAYKATFGKSSILLRYCINQQSNQESVKRKKTAELLDDLAIEESDQSDSVSHSSSSSSSSDSGDEDELVNLSKPKPKNSG